VRGNPSIQRKPTTFGRALTDSSHRCHESAAIIEPTFSEVKCATIAHMVLGFKRWFASLYVQASSYIIGNAAFHSDSLYTTLSPSIPILVQLLSDPLPRTRSNAAGLSYLILFYHIPSSFIPFPDLLILNFHPIVCRCFGKFSPTFTNTLFQTVGISGGGEVVDDYLVLDFVASHWMNNI
jgi:hypothetical protein